MSNIKVEVYKTFFKVIIKGPTAEVDISLDSLKKFLTDYEIVFLKNKKKQIKINSKLFYKNDLENTYIFPISVLRACITILKSKFSLNSKEVKYFIDSDSENLFFNIRDNYKLRDYQELYLGLIIDKKSPPYVLIDLKPGAGKTFISVNALQRLKKKVAIVILPKYIDKWLADIELYTDIPKDRIYCIEGNSSIQNILENDLDYDIYIISIRTFYNYINMYENDPTITSPTEVFKRMKVGVLLSDESHQETVSLSRIVMYSDVEKVIGLSATYVATSKKDKDIQSVLFPNEVRISNLVKFDTYIDIIEVGYLVNPSYKLKAKSNYGYNHIKYEQSISRLNILKLTYYDMLIRYMVEYYFALMEKGEKCLVFFSTIHTCTDFVNYLKKKFPEYKVNRYVGEDSYEDLLNGDIVVSTLGKYLPIHYRNIVSKSS